MSDQDSQLVMGGKARRAPVILVTLPLILFAGLALLFAVGLRTGDPSKLPSRLIGSPAPPFNLPGIEGLIAAERPVPGFSNEALAKGRVSIVNVWASWCAPCHAEHPHLTLLAKLDGVALYGINYKDRPEEARRFLGRYGNPFVAVGTDREGRAAIDWGVYGVPETFIIDGRGFVLYRHVGPISPEVIERDLMPVIRRARAG